MSHAATRRPFARLLGTAVALSALAACTPPGATVPVVGYVGGGALPLDVLAVTQIDAETGNTSFRVALKWSTALGTKSYEIWRKFGDQPMKVLTTTDKDSYVDTSLTAKQAATYKIRAVGGDAKEIRASEEKATTVLTQEVAKPDGLEPADNAVLGSTETTPTLKWKAVANASLYHVKVVKVSDDSAVFSATTKDTSIKFADKSPLAFDKFADLFAVGNPAGLQKGIVYRWTVQALRTDGGADMAKIKAVDVNTSTASKFSLGQ